MRERFAIVAVVSISGLLTGLSVILPQLWLLVWIAPTPFLFALFSDKYASTRREAFILGILFGTVFNLAVSASAWSAYPLDWVGIPSPLASIAIIGGISLGSSLCMGLAHTLLALVVFEIRSRTHSPFVLLTALPFLWGGAEYLQAILFSLYALGPTSTVNAFSQVASIAYAFGHATNSFWIALARWGGMPLLGAFPVLTSACLALSALFYDSPSKRAQWALGAGLVLSVFLVSSVLAANDAEVSRGSSAAWGSVETLTVVVGKTDFPAQFIQTKEVLAARNKIVYSIAEELRARNIAPDAVILPETVGNALDVDGYERISRSFAEGTLLVHSKYGDGTPRTARTFSHVIGGETFVTDKQYIMPYGEYPPYHFLAILKLFPPDVSARLHEHREYIGGAREEMGPARGVEVGVRLCSEILSPKLYRTLAKNGAGVLVQSSSIKIFEGAPILQWVMRSAARIRAVENGLPLVQVMNGAPSGAYDCTGRIITPKLDAENFKVYEIERKAACRRLKSR